MAFAEGCLLSILIANQGFWVQFWGTDFGRGSLHSSHLVSSAPALDSLGPDPYSFSFRTYSLKSTMQRSVGSVGVEALPGWQLRQSV
jgi:hypothetical protein